MRFALSPEQREFGVSLRELLSGAGVPAAARRWADGDHAAGLAIWRRLGELGVTALAVPERFDGLAAHPVDLVVAVEELGYHAVPGPVVESLAVVPTLLAELDEHGERWLPSLAAGTAIGTCAFHPHVPHAVDADVAAPVLAVRDDAVHLATPGAQLSSVDGTRRLFRVEPRERVTTGAGHAFDLGVLACAAQLLGAGRKLLDTTVEYATQRRQFGRPVGAFQAVKHQLADVHTALELARPLVYGAAITLAERSPDAGRDVSAARVAVADAAYRAARTALQVHGAVGYTREHDLSLWLTRVRALRSAWGTQSFHRGRVLSALCTR